MSKTKECKKVLCKYLAQLMFTKVISENDSKIINEFLSDDTIILSKKKIKKHIEVKTNFPPYLVCFGVINEWKDEYERLADDCFLTALENMPD